MKKYKQNPSGKPSETGDAIEIRAFADLSALQVIEVSNEQPNVWHGFFTRRGGLSGQPYESLNVAVSSGDDRLVVEQNRKKILKTLGLDEGFLRLSPNLSHTSAVAVVTNSDGYDMSSINYIDGVDAIITTVKRSCIMFGTADCNPIVFVDRKKDIIGLAHAGWKGVLGGLPDKVIQEMISLGSDPADILVAVGPSIGPCCYRLANPLQATLPEWEPYTSLCDCGLTSIDLWTPVSDQICARGVPLGNVHLSRMCTACNSDRFFSYWVAKPTPTGRFATVVFMR